MLIVVMGVSGVGKSTLGKELAKRLQCEFLDGDDYHSPENIKKLAAGNPLTDADRQPWLQTLHGLLATYNARRRDVVLACSALKQKYRDTIAERLPVQWVYLKSPEAEIAERLARRVGHFANPRLLHSQLEILEEPTDAIIVEVRGKPAEEVDRIIPRLLLGPRRPAGTAGAGS